MLSFQKARHQNISGNRDILQSTNSLYHSSSIFPKPKPSGEKPVSTFSTCFIAPNSRIPLSLTIHPSRGSAETIPDNVPRVIYVSVRTAAIFQGAHPLLCFRCEDEGRVGRKFFNQQRIFRGIYPGESRSRGTEGRTDPERLRDSGNKNHGNKGDADFRSVSCSRERSSILFDPYFSPGWTGPGKERKSRRKKGPWSRGRGALKPTFSRSPSDGYRFRSLKQSLKTSDDNANPQPQPRNKRTITPLPLSAPLFSIRVPFIPLLSTLFRLGFFLLLLPRLLSKAAQPRIKSRARPDVAKTRGSSYGWPFSRLAIVREVSCLLATELARFMHRNYGLCMLS